MNMGVLSAYVTVDHRVDCTQLLSELKYSIVQCTSFEVVDRVALGQLGSIASNAATLSKRALWQLQYWHLVEGVSTE